MPGQKQLRAQRGEQVDETHGDTKRRTLLERLAAFGVSRQDEPGMAHETTAPAPRIAQPNSVHAEYGKRGAQAARNASNRSTRRAASSSRAAIDEDQLEIPAFLRRQSS